jgi:hypothetical protein
MPKHILAHAQGLVYTLLHLMPSPYQQETLQALLGLFLEATGQALPAHSCVKSASAISRFLNQYHWPTRQVIRAVRQAAIAQLLQASVPGRRPYLQVILDLTTLEKTGKFKGLADLIRVYHSKRGLHLVVLYLVVGKWRLPWNFRIYRGKGTSSPAQLGLQLLRRLPQPLTKRFQVLVLADTGFGSIEFLEGTQKLGYHTIVGVRRDRKQQSGEAISRCSHRGQQTQLVGLSLPVWVSWFWLKRDNGKRELRYVLSTKPLKGSTMTRWGKRRWQIEGWFKTAKHRFGLHRFGQGTLVGVYRWLVLSMIAYLLAHWAYLTTLVSALPVWTQAARLALELWLPHLLVISLIVDVQRLRPRLHQFGLDLHLSWCKI